MDTLNALVYLMLFFVTIVFMVSNPYPERKEIQAAGLIVLLAFLSVIMFIANLAQAVHSTW